MADKLNVGVGITYNPRGLKQVKKELSAFDRGLKTLAKSFASIYSAQKIASFGKASVKAFAADDKAARILSGTLKNLGLAYADKNVKNYIDSLEKQFGVLDDQLRPAYQTLLTQTGDWRESQRLLQTALNLSAQSGRDVVSVAADLSKAYAGNTRGLIKYSLGFSKAELAATTFEEILAKIAVISEGQAALAADTISGKLNKIDAASKRASETIGGALVDSFASLAGNGDIDKSISKFDTFIATVAGLIRVLSGATSMKSIFAGVDLKFNPQNFRVTVANKMASTNRSRSPAGVGLNTVADRQARDKIAKEKAAELALLRAKNLATLAALKLAADEKQLEELRKKFDQDRIQIGAALLSATDEETKVKLRAQLAIIDGDTKNARSLNALMDAQFLATLSVYGLSGAAQAAADAWGALLNGMLGSNRGTAAITSATPNNPATPTPELVMPPTNLPSVSGNAEITNAISGITGPAGMFASTNNTFEINVNAGTITNEQGVSDLVQRTIQELLGTGRGFTYAGAIA